MDQKILTKLEKLELAIGELQKAVVAIVGSMVTKEDAKNFATKDDLMAMEKRLTKEIRDVEIDVTISADKNKTDKSDFDRLEKRVKRIESQLAA